jgi:hypothetical protein
MSRDQEVNHSHPELGAPSSNLCVTVVSQDTNNPHYKCSECSLLFPSRCALKQHKRQSHQLSVLARLPDGSTQKFTRTENGSFICSCGYKTAVPRGFSKHKRACCFQENLIIQSDNDLATPDGENTVCPVLPSNGKILYYPVISMIHFSFQVQ